MSRICWKEGCTKEPTYAVKGFTKRISCNKHRKEYEKINSCSLYRANVKICEFPTCYYEATYRKMGTVEKTRCYKHAKGCSDYERARGNRRKCILCKIKCASFGFKNYTKRILCAGCRKQLIDTFNKSDNDEKSEILNLVKAYITGKEVEIKNKCEICNVDFISSKKQSSCPKCIKDTTRISDENIPKKVEKSHNVKYETENIELPDFHNKSHRQCEGDPKCTTVPKFNYKDEKHGLRCGKHKLKEMIDVTTVRCRHKGCGTFASYGKNGKTALYCAKHGLPLGMKLVDRHLCKQCKNRRAGSKYKYLCYGCYQIIHHSEFVEKMIPGKMKMWPKETYVFKAVNDVFHKNGYTFILNSRFKGAKSKKIPDMHIILKTHMIVIEVDEYQHTKPVYFCRQKHEPEDERISQLMSDINGLPLVVIRFNPDDYTDDKGKLHPPLIYIKKNEVMVRHSEYYRIDQLLAKVSTFIKTIPVKNLITIKMFFDRT
jgi:hypothetical protein